MTDTERIDWMAHAGDLDISVIQDAPHDGEFLVRADFVSGYGETIRAAIDSAINSSNGQTEIEANV